MLDLFSRPLASVLTLPPDFLSGGGEAGERMRAHEWSRTALGPARDWPQGLRIAVRLVLAARQPMCILWGPSHTLLFNDACRAILGERHEAMFAQPAAAAWSEFWQAAAHRVELALQRNEGSCMDGLALVADRAGLREDAHYSVTFSPLPGEPGACAGVLCAFADVTAAVATQHGLALAEKLTETANHLSGELDLQSLVQKVTDIGVELTGAQFGAFFYNMVNDAGESYQLYTLSGAPREAFSSFGMPRNTAVFKPTFDGGAPVRVDDITKDPRYGRSAPHRGMPKGHLPVRSYLAVPVVARDGEVLGGLFFGHARAGVFDARAERAAVGVAAQAAVALENARRVERLTARENELRELDQRKDEFLATLAHELRNPLAPLRNGLEVLRIAHDNKHMTEKARAMMQRQLHQMVRLVDDLLDVSRVSRGKIELRRDNIELASVLRNAMETSQPLMVERGHELVARIPQDKIVVHADMTRLSQVFWNLLNNAAKYTEAGGRIELSVAMAGGTVAVTVRDNGIGIPPEMHGRVFDIFTQVDRSLEKSQGGLGIGLSIARRLVEMHGGRITVQSDGHGSGSAFTVTLPAAIVPRAAEIPSGSAVSAGVTPMACRRILIADDNADSVTTLSIMLEMLGNEVRVAHDGEAAVRAAQEFQPDAILLDIGMPKLNGYDACSRLRSIPETADAYMVALTGWGQEEDRIRAKDAGFDHHMIKPVEPALLEKLIAELPRRPA